MATLSAAEPRRLYSWWWDSHISPKNSKWLQEDLTDMDIRVKSMIKIIEEDADSFAKRAEMYYKKRPELMKLVEEFYRAYRALAERYDHATGALRQAHRTMAEPSYVFSDDSPPTASSSTASEPCTPEMHAPIHALSDTDDLQKEASGLLSDFHFTRRNGKYTEDLDVLASRKGLKQVNEMFASAEGTPYLRLGENRVWKGLHFFEEEANESQFEKYEGKEDHLEEAKNLQSKISRLSSENENPKVQIKSESQSMNKVETEVQRLKEINSKLKSEMDNAALFHGRSLRRMSDLENENDVLRKLNSEFLIKESRLNTAEQKCLLLEEENRLLLLERGALEQKINELQEGLLLKQEELEKLKVSFQEKHLQFVHVEASLYSLKELYTQSLEELNADVLQKAATLDCLCIFFEQLSAETTDTLKMVSNDFRSVQKVKNGLEKKLEEMAEMMETVEADLNMANNANQVLNYQIEELNQQIETKNNLLTKKEMEISEAFLKLQTFQGEKTGLESNLLAIKMELDETKSVKDELGKKVLVFTKEIANRSKEIAFVSEENDVLGMKLQKLQKEDTELRDKEKRLASNLLNEVRHCEEEFIFLINDTQLAFIQAMIFEEKVVELMQLCESIQIEKMVQKMAVDEDMASRSVGVENLKENLYVVEQENKWLKAEFGKCLPVVSSLWDIISPLEDYILLTRKNHVIHDHEIHDDGGGRSQSITTPQATKELHKLLVELEALQKNLKETEEQLAQASFDVHAKPDPARHKNGKFRSNNPWNESSNGAVTELEGHMVPAKRCELENDYSKNPDRDESIMKDIQLDHISSSFRFEVGSVLCGTGMSNNVQIDDQVLELWETSEKDCNAKTHKAHLVPIEDDREHHLTDPKVEEKSEYPSSKLVAEKELDIDMLGIQKAKNNRDSHHDWNRILGRLSSDSERLAALRSSARELIRKMGSVVRSNHPKYFEFVTVKAKVIQAEESIIQLIDMNGKVVKKAKDYSSTTSDDSILEPEELRNQRRLVSRYARRMSVKIERLELELQKMQYVSLKFEEGNGSCRTRTVDRNSRVVLGDYLFGQNGRRRKTQHFCGCVETKAACYI